MRTVMICTLVVLCAFFSTAQEKTSAVIVRGPHHNVILQVEETRLEDGSVLKREREIVEMATGLNHLSEGRYTPSIELFEPHPNGSIAHHGIHKVAISANINTRGAVQIMGEDGVTLQMSVLGIAYTSMDGRSVLVSGLKDAIGQIQGNEVIFRDCLSDTVGDIRFRYTRNGFEQDVILAQPLEPPSVYNLPDDQCRLEIWNELHSEVQPTITKRDLESVLPAGAEPAVLGPLRDSTIHFGSLQFSPGRAFTLQGGDVDVPVAKTLVETEGRRFIVEAVEYKRVARAVADLAKPQANRAPQKPGALLARVSKPVNGVVQRPFPATPRKAEAADLRPMRAGTQTAQLGQNGKGLVMDYIVNVTSGLTNFVFKSDGTYSVTGPCVLYGSNVVMGGSVTKFAAISSNPCLEFNGTIFCDTKPWHMAIFTSRLDGTLGDPVASGTISGYYASTALRSSTTVTGELHDLRISHAGTAIKWYGSTNRFSNIQLVNCATGIHLVSATNVSVHNILATNVSTLFAGNDTAIDAEHITANVVGTLSQLTGTPSALGLTNSLLVNVTNAGSNSITADYVAINGSLTLTGLVTGWSAPSPVFQAPVVGGAHYLSSTSGLRQLGTTNIAPRLLKELAALSTWAPTSLVNVTITNSTIFSNSVPRMNPLYPDIGYAYSPIDLILCGVKLNTNVTLTVTNGCVIAGNFASSSWAIIFDTARLISIASATNMNKFIRAHNIQEKGTGNPGTRAFFHDLGTDGISHGNSEARFRFTEIVDMASDGYMLYTGRHWSQFELSHCLLLNRSMIIAATKGSQVFGLTNNVVEWGSINFSVSGSSSKIHLQNNLFRNFRVDLVGGTTNWTANDNLFDNTGAYDSGVKVSNTNNAYYPSTVNRLTNGTDTIILTNLSYETGPLSRYYQPSNSVLSQAGSVTADKVGLFHFTGCISQIPETNSIVDVGPHFVALDGNGQLLDSDGDLIPNVTEDPNGNGVQDAGETDWNNLDTDGDGVPDGIELIQGRSPLVGATNDVNGVINLKVYTPLK